MGLAVGTSHLSGYKHSKQAATGTSPNSVEVYVGHLSHMKTPAPPKGEQNNVLQYITITEGLKWPSHVDDDGNITNAACIDSSVPLCVNDDNES